MVADSLEAKRRDLVEDLESLLDRLERRRKRSRRWNSTLVAGSLLAAALTIGGGGVGALNSDTLTIWPSVLAGAGGVAVGMFRSMESAFSFGEKADFYRILVRECRNLIIAAKYSMETEEHFDTIIEKYKSVNSREATQLPKGEGMQQVKLLYEELDSKGVIPVSPELLSQAD